MERIIFGDNQFFGVNHISDQKSRDQSIRFRNDISILDTLDKARNAGVNTFMCTTHDRMINICKLMRASGEKYMDYTIYPCIPYAHKYANAVTELGMTGAIKQFLPDNFLGSFLKGSTAVVTRNYIAMMELLIDAELKMFKGLHTPIIFLQNVVTDLLLGLGMEKVFLAFDEYVRSKYHAEPAYITMNLPALKVFLKRAGIQNPLICTSINKDGFRMSGGQALYEAAIADGDCRVIAMQVFSGGASSPAASLEYVCALQGVASILFGASSSQHIEQTVGLIRQFDVTHNRNEQIHHIKAVV
jgi:hypothetical protein